MYGRATRDELAGAVDQAALSPRLAASPWCTTGKDAAMRDGIPAEEAGWLFDLRKKIDEGHWQLAQALVWCNERPARYDLVEHHVRLAQGKLAIALVDLPAARTASARGKAAVSSESAADPLEDDWITPDAEWS